MPVLLILKTKSKFIKGIVAGMFYSEIYNLLIPGYLEFVFIPIFNLQSKKDDPDLNTLNKTYS